MIGHSRIRQATRPGISQARFLSGVLVPAGYFFRYTEKYKDIKNYSYANNSKKINPRSECKTISNSYNFWKKVEEDISLKGWRP